MKRAFDDTDRRAAELAQNYPSAASLLSFYRELARFQKSVSEDVQSNAVTDVRALDASLSGSDRARAAHRPATDRRVWPEHLQVPARRKNCCSAFWENGPLNELTGVEAARFFARVLLQPYAEYLASRGDIAAR